ncbi:MAG: putative metal-binding motif-containing protein [Bradymonadia bacterium]
MDPHPSPSPRCATLVWVCALAVFGLTGCPPSGDVPPFEPPSPDMELPADTSVPDAEPMRPECVDQDGDRYVQALDCGGDLPGGDCAPFDPQRHPERPELCDDIDNDCDEQIDEDFSLGEACEDEALVGACRAGIFECRGGQAVCEPTDRNGSDELCNGIDDDCDGTIDETFPTAGEVCPTGFQGVCAEGTHQCRMTGEGTFEVVCVPDVEPDDERPEVLCDNIDEDCDGAVDEGNPEGGEACQSDLPGLCLEGTLTCSEEGVVCQPDVQPGELPERCNTFDDDCDGTTDEGFDLLGQACTVGEGACVREGVYACDLEGQAGVICDAEPGRPDVAELCNGEDDDCDGTTDEGFDTLGDACEVGVGACLRSGALVCAEDGSGTTCDAAPGDPVIEQCNGIDDDCDGAIDETFVELGLGGPCVDESGQCPSPGTYVCADDGSGLRCDAEPVSPVPELCDGLDNDCDGVVDDDFPELGDACEVGVGACTRAGVRVCTEEGLGTTCDARPGEPAAELCDGIDNDCDGLIDDRAVCPDPLTVRVTLMAIADSDDERCADLGAGGAFDGAPDNALGAVAALYNQSLALSVANSDRVPLLRAPALSVEAPFPLEFLEGELIGETIQVRREGLDPLGEAVARIPEVSLLGRRLATGEAAERLEVISPFVYSFEPALRPFSTVQMTDAALNGPLVEGGELALRIADAALTGALERQQIMDDYIAAESACAEFEAEARPSGCAIFDQVTSVQLAEALVADLDRDEDGTPESVSACFIVQTVSVAEDEVQMPQLGGLPCDRDEVCLDGLICRPIVITTDPELGAATERRCGLPGILGFEEGNPCSNDNDCRSGLCASLTLGGFRCVDLCAGDEDCEVGAACLGVHLGTPGAIGLGGATGRVCVTSEGSALPCDNDDACAPGERCALWFEGEIGVAGGDVSLAGRCQTPSPGDRSVGTPCGADRECANGYACVEDGQGGRRCLTPCTGIGRCPEGNVCLEGQPVASVSAPEASFGYCTPLTPAIGSGATCTVDLDCPGGETCKGYFLDITGQIQRYCGTGEGLFTVGQACVVGQECASGQCVDGLCSGTCEDNDDCGTRLGCRPGATVEPETGVEIAGACLPADQICARDADCNFGGDPACAGGRCVCDIGRCRIGCRYPGICPDGLLCQPDNTCVRFCKDDLEEPNEVQALATALDIGRGQTAVFQRRRMCITSGVDWYRFNNGGQPFRVLVRPEDSPRARMGLAVVNALGESLPGAVEEIDGTLSYRLNDPVAAEALLQEEIYLEVRAGGFTGAFDYQLEVELLVPECPDDEITPQDGYWQYTPLLHGVDQLSESVDSWLCPQDEDWYGIRLYGGDTLTLDLETLGDGVGVALEVHGPDWPDLPEVNVFDEYDDAVGVVASLSADAEGGQLVIEAPELTCNLELSQCEGENGTSPFSCETDDDCGQSNIFIRVVGESPIGQRQYRLSASVQRQVPPECPKDLREVSNFIGGMPSVRALASIDPVARTTLLGIPTLDFNREIVLRHMTLCSGGADVFPFLAEPGDRITAEVTQLGQPQEIALQFLSFDFRQAELEVYDNTVAAQETLRRSVVVEREDVVFHGVQVMRAEGPGVLRYELSIEREPPGQVPDDGCNAPTRLTLSALTQTAIAEGTTAGARDDDVPLSCIGGAGPDRAFVIAVPGPGTVEAVVEATANDGYDPSVYIRTACAAPASGVACNEDDESAPNPLTRARAEGPVLGAGDIYVIVDSFSAQTTGAFRLTFTWTPQ